MTTTTRPALRQVLALLVTASLAFVYGYLAHKHAWFPHGVWTSIRSTVSTEEAPAEADGDDPLEVGFARMNRRRPRGGDRGGDGGDTYDLDGIGYLGGVRPAAGDTWVTVHVPEFAQPGYNLLTSGHGPEALLMDMDGEVLHSWKLPFESVWPDRKPRTRHETYWRRARLFPNGDLLVLFSYVALVKIDRNSEVIWQSEDAFHHDMQLLDDGRIVTIGRRHVKKRRVGGGEPIWDELIVTLDAEGNQVDSISIFDALEKSPWSAALRRIDDQYEDDVFHANAVRVLGEELASAGEAFRPGNILVSLRHLDLVVVLDPESKSVVWAQTDLWARQHDPRPTPAGTLVVFDNAGARPAARVVEMDPATGQVVWTYRGTRDAPFHSRVCGTVQPLENGNFLISESQGGRAFEVQRDRRIVWEFRNPFRAGKDREMIALVFELERLPVEFPLDWIPPR